MRLTLKLKYIQKHKGGFRYRRKYPQDVASALDTIWHLAPLGTSELIAAENWKRVNAAYEKRVQEVRALSAAKSPFQTYTEGVKLIREMGFSTLPVTVDAAGSYRDPPPPEDAARSQAAHKIIEQYPVDPLTGHPTGMSEVHEFVVRALLDRAPPKPSPTFSDAVQLYKLEKIDGSAFEKKKKEQRVDRLAAAFKSTVGADPEIVAVDREDARKFRDYLLSKGTMKPTSVKRELNVMKAIFNHAIVENGLSNHANPFNRLPIPGLEMVVEVDDRDPLPPEVLKKVRERVCTNAKTELQLIWRLLEGTGCRIGEITGLRREDVEAKGETPNITVTWHEGRRLKNKSSRRQVPLVGDALDAAREAVRLAGKRPMLFIDYGGSNGPTNASSSLMRHVRMETDNPRHVVHSLRHNMSDWILASGASDTVKNLILGHSIKGVGERTYGSTHARLQALTIAMKKAIKARLF